VIDWRSANGDYNRAQELVADLVKSKVDVIVVENTLAAETAKRATSRIPIVMALVADPVASGLVKNLAHPGGNVTGLSAMMTDLSAKRLQLLKETLPHSTRVAVFWNPDTPWHPKVVQELRSVARTLSIQLTFIQLRNEHDIGVALAAAVRARATSLFFLGDAFLLPRKAQLVELTAQARMPAIYWVRDFVEEGGLLSYGASLGDLFRRSAAYVDKILKGASPGDLPIEQPSKLELVVNLKTAKALGIAIPQSVLLRADQVVQ
jgi:putative ABC transport system substrate-binding protein